MFPEKMKKTETISSKQSSDKPEKPENETVTDKFKDLSPAPPAAEAPKKKGKLGRPSKEPEPEFKPFQIFDKEDLKLAVSIVPFGLIAGLTKDKKWLLTEKEKNHLAPKVDKVITKYMPAFTYKYAEETELAFSIAAKLIIHAQMPAQPVESPGPESANNNENESENTNY